MDRTRSVKKRLQQALHVCAVTASVAGPCCLATAAEVNAQAPKNGCRALRGHG
jgi:hypothetical protein